MFSHTATWLIAPTLLVIPLVSDGVQAIEALETDTYHLVLMDCQMPVMDRFQAIRKSTLSKLNPAIPIIAMTANATAQDRERCLDTGMDDSIPKPIRPEMLSAIIEKWLRSGNRS